MKKKLKDELEDKSTVQEYVCPGCAKRCDGELVAESDKLAAQDVKEGDDNARRRRREKLKDMLQKMEALNKFSTGMRCNSYKDDTVRIHEQRCLEHRKEADALKMRLEKTKLEHDAKVAELEKKLKAKEEVEGAANSMMNRMNGIKEKLRSLDLGGIDTDSLKMPKEQLTNCRESYERRSRSRGRSIDSRKERRSKSRTESPDDDDFRSDLRKNGGKTLYRPKATWRSNKQ